VVKRAWLLLLVGCTSAELAPPVYSAHRGPAADRVVRKIVALPATCGALSQTGAKAADGSIIAVPAKCPNKALASVNQMIRSQLDFLGMQVLDSDKVNAVTASRHEVEVRKKFDTTITAEWQGSLFDDATPKEQADILRELGADAVLSTRVFIGAGIGFAARRTVVVQVRLRTADNGTLIWAHRCAVEIGGIDFDIDGIQDAARCAMGKAP
jgi:hypothetical protein